MSFVVIVVAVWAVAMAAWFVVSKYFKSADLTRVKARLLGTAKVKQAKKDTERPQVLTKTVSTENNFAQVLVEKYQLGPKIGAFLEQAGVNWTPARFVHLTIIACGSGMAVTWLFLPLPGLTIPVIGALTGALPFFQVWRKRRARLKKFEEIFPDALEFVARSMRAGHAFSVSLEMIHREFPEPVSSEFRRTFEEHNLGLPIETALQKLAKRVPSLDVHFFVSAVLLQKRTGGNLAEILDKLAYVIRERFKLRGRIRAVSAHGKMTATALSLIPVAVAILMFYTNPDYVKFFFTDDVGNIMLGSAVVLQLIGYAIMKKIVDIEV
ncbi:MAG TPA: type II secretion system F family protein [Bryobacteraceae bacterium]|nr:type II secretion system F family protein [Bryobacteraceae bacterium]